MISFVLACIWIISAKLIAMMPTRDYHWRGAYVLAAIGLPILVFVFWQHGLWVGLVAMAAGGFVLRWPVYYLFRRIRRTLIGGGPDV
jgi:hypothetical protein